MSNPHTEQAYEDFEDNINEVFQDAINHKVITDSEIVDLILDDPKLYTAVVDAWCAIPANKEKLREWYMAGLPDGPEDDPKEDR